VDDALAGVAHGVEADAELGGVGPQCLDLREGDRVLDGPERGGDVVVLGGHGQVRAAHGAVSDAQAVEGLGGGDLVDEVQVDVQQVGLAARAAAVHDVAVPDLLGECLGHRGLGFLGGSLSRIVRL